MVGAGPFKVIVPAPMVPPVIELAAKLTPVIVGGTSVSVAVTVAPPADAEMVMFSDFFTELVVIWKVAVVAPAGIVKEAGTVASAPPLLKATTRSVGVARFNVTEPVGDVPPATELGVMMRPVGVRD